MAEQKVKGTNGAEHKTKGTNGNHAPDKTPSKQSKLRQLLVLAQEVSKDAEAIEDYERTVEGRRALEADLEAKAYENQTLRDLNGKVMKEFSEHKAQANIKRETLVAEFEQRYKTWESNKAAVESMELEVAGMREQLAAAKLAQQTRAGEADGLRKQLRAAEAEAKARAAEVKDMGAECEVHRSRMQTSIAELDACKTKLSLAQGDLGEDLLRDYGPEGLRDLGLKLKALAKQCHGLVMEYFNDPDGAEDSASEIQDLKARFPKLPLSAATTRSAALMRCAVAEAVIAEVLTSQIFVPFYLPNNTRGAASTLLELFGDDERRRTVYRCQILRATLADEAEAARVQDEVVRRAGNELRSTLHPLVVAFKQAGFYQAVPALCKEAQVLWAEVQRSRDLITAEPPDGDEVPPPGRYEEYDNRQQQNGGKGNNNNHGNGNGNGNNKKDNGAIAAVLFPQVATREDLIFNGMALWSNQGALAAAAMQEGPANGEAAKPAPAVRRRSMVAPESPFRNK